MTEQILHTATPTDPELENDAWVRVAMLHLSSRNFTPIKLHQKWVRSFLFRLSCRLRVHLAVVVGSEFPVTHSHLAIAVPANEVERFRTNLKKHRIADWWKSQHDPRLEPWEPSLADRGMTYIGIKHALWEETPEVFCPRKAHTCEKGNCPHR